MQLWYLFSGATPLVLCWCYSSVDTLAQTLFWCFYSGAWLYSIHWFCDYCSNLTSLWRRQERTYYARVRTRLLSLHSEVQWIMSENQRLWDYDRHLIPSIRTINVYDKKKRNITESVTKLIFHFYLSKSHHTFPRIVTSSLASFQSPHVVDVYRPTGHWIPLSAIFDYWKLNVRLLILLSSSLKSPLDSTV